MVSSLDRTNVGGAGGSYLPAFSADERFVAFTSHARNLVTNDDSSPYLRVFARDLTLSNTVMVSVNTTGMGGANADAGSPSISSNGQFVAFASSANNLVNNDTNDASDVFLRDVVSGTTTLVSVDVTGASSAGVLSPWTRYRLSGNPLISGDGRWVVFESLATNLVSLPDANQTIDIFARDVHSNKTSLVSINAAGTGSGNGKSDSASISPDGRFVAFVSTATDLAPGTVNQSGDIYVRDLQAGTTTWASIKASTILFASTGYTCFNPVISWDGRFVAFKATVDSSSVVLICHDLQAGVSVVLSRNTFIDSPPQISSDGRFVASEDLNDVRVWDLSSGSNVLVSVSADGSGGGNQPSHTPVMTPGGGSVAFLSAAANLASNATNGVSQVFVRDLTARTTRLASANLSGTASSRDIDVTPPAISGDGRLVVFESLGPDLVVNDLNQASDIFLRDLDGRTTQLVSQRDRGLPESTGGAMTTAFANSMSADGRLLAFGSLDANLVPSDDDERRNLFVRDIVSGTLSRLSVDQVPFIYGQIGIEPAMSANGCYLSFGTRAPTLFPFQLNEDIVRYDLQTGRSVTVSTGAASTPAISSDGNLVVFQNRFQNRSNIFVADMTLGTNKLVSMNSGSPGDSANGDSINPILSADDRWVVFASTAQNLTTNVTSGSLNLFARDLGSNTTRMISVGPDGSSPLGYLRGAVGTADSAHAAFVSTSNSVAVYDFSHRTGTVVCVGCDNPSLSADGRLVAYEMTNAGSPREIFLEDLQSGTNRLISINRLGAGGGNGDSTSPLLSWDGRFVVFASKASDLVDNDTNNASDIFVRDLILGTTMLVSVNWQGSGSGNSPSTKPVLAADGRTILFQSFASDLIPGDYNDQRDVFVLRLGGPDTDHDGMDDDWEMAYFGTLVRDGTGDFDGDGRTDLQEFQAGTDPANAHSVLRAITVAPLGGGAAKVIWSASPGKHYQVQFRDDLKDGGWNTLRGLVTVGGTTGWMVDNATISSNHRFYRVLLLP